MKYQNVLIICKKENGEELQKYLFKLGYYFMKEPLSPVGRKNKNIYIAEKDFCIVIKNDRSLHWNYLIKNVYYRKDDFKVLHYPNCIRLEKLKKLNYV